MPTDAPDSRAGRARIAVSVVFFVNGAGLAGYVAHLPDIQLRLHLSNSLLGGAMIFSAIGAISTMMVGGPLIHRFGSRVVTAVAGSILLVVLPFVVVAPSLPLVCLTLYLIGASNGQFDVSMNTHSMEVQKLFHRPIVSAIHGWFSLGGFAGAAGVALGAGLHLPPIASMIASSVVLGSALAWGVTGMLRAPKEEDAEAAHFVWPTGFLLFLGVLTMIAFMSEGAIWDWSAVYLRRVMHSGGALGALGFGLTSFAMAVGRFVGDYLIHRLGYRGVLLGSSIATAFGIILAVTVPTVPSSMAGFIFAGFGLANIVPILFQVAGSRPGISTGMGLAAVSTCAYTGFLVGPPIVGRIADWRSLGFSLGLIAILCLTIGVTSHLTAGDLDGR